ncbi:GNAT family N-acetyltransferase [Roseomonas sp. E05]|uniref:GNAT family N-acetyltransferase n=1 Tax=Roseomonas sp. E05 TaxID=3046310 RepID=UPI0024BBCCF7|nr:GNAT family N-acetyltransferase [Roseomonas sp. E05]MDJ0386773.1 GNAT family N-acetyltransferase [Roseomonas sp. E05]
MSVGIEITTIAERPDLAPLVAGWLWEAFWREAGHGLAETRAAVEASVARSGPPQAFVLLAGGEPVATASLVAGDLAAFPELTPWLAGLFVLPAVRGQGHARRLIARVEAAARQAGSAAIWLYTGDAEGLYARAGWDVVERLPHGAGTLALMRRDLTGEE